jgi:hypothetical protein
MAEEKGSNMAKENRRAVEMPINLVVLVLVGLLIAVVLFKGVNFANTGQGTLIDAGKEATSTATNNFAKVCEDWQATDRKQDPGYILGGFMTSSIPKAASSFGATFACCTKEFEGAAQTLRATQLYFTPDGTRNWTLWQDCYAACQRVIDLKRQCQMNFPGGENSPDFLGCLSGGVASLGC